MKLVELLAAKIKEWPEGAKNITQDHDGSVSPCTDPHNDLEFDGARWSSTNGFKIGIDIIGKQERASDYKTAIVTRAQWQTERDRQKGGEWKRHRGGKQPVADDVVVEVKLRDGDSQQARASAFLWYHSQCDTYANIMQYRVISQQQAEEVKLSRLEARMLFSEPCIIYPESTEAKADQIDGPIKWRDTIIHCQAIIEDCEHEIERNRQRLADEGFTLIQPITDVHASEPEVDMSDWRNWKAGDVVECLTAEYSGTYTKGKQYIVEWVKDEVFSVFDDHGEDSSCDWFDDEAEGLKFIRRP